MLPFEPLLHVPTEFLLLWCVVPLRGGRYYAAALCNDECATLGELREAVTTLEDTTRIARRVLGSAHPHTTVIEGALQHARAALRARETQPPPRSA